MTQVVKEEIIILIKKSVKTQAVEGNEQNHARSENGKVLDIKNSN